METIFINTENSKTNKPHRFRLTQTVKLNIKNPHKNMVLAKLSIYYTRKSIKSSHKNNKFKISAPTWNDKFDFPVGSYSISDIQDYFEYIIKKHKIIANNPSVQIYVDKIKNRIVFKINTRHQLELLSPETMKLLGNIIKYADLDKDEKDVSKLESVEVVLKLTQ